MAEFFLKYGDGRIPIRFPDRNLEQFVEVSGEETAAPGENIVRERLARPLNAQVAEKVCAGRKVLLLVNDSTRKLPYPLIIKELGAALRKCAELRLLMCTGTHQAETPGNREIVRLLKESLAAADVSHFSIHIHDARQGEFLNAGVTKFGTRVRVNSLAGWADAFMVISDMKNHYFAGYSNILKNFLPGMCALSSVEKNHSLALHPRAAFGRHPWHPDSSRRDNPLAKDMLEAYELIRQERPVWAVVIITKGDHILWCGAGDPQSVSRAAMVEVDRRMSREIRPADALILGCGGYPNDESLYISQRALELNQAAVRPGGRVLFLAECRNGIGPPASRKNFFDLLQGDLEEVLRIIEQKYVMYSHKAYKFARMITNLGFLGMTSKLSANLVASIHLTPVADPQRQVEEWLSENPDLKINVVADGNKIALHAGNSGAV